MLNFDYNSSENLDRKTKRRLEKTDKPTNKIG